MKLYFNPYPDAAQSIEEGVRCLISATDALIRLENELRSNSLIPFMDSNAPFSSFILVREHRGNSTLIIQSVIQHVERQDRDKIIWLLQKLGKGRVIDSTGSTIENWNISNINISIPTPVLEIAAKDKAIAFTIPTDHQWEVNTIEFVDREEFLHNLWGQEDLSLLIEHCNDALEDAPARFCAIYKAEFCEDALDSVPKKLNWENAGFFRDMDKAKKRKYEASYKKKDLIKIVGDTKYGQLLELRCMASGWRIFFVFRKNMTPEIMIGGFYAKNTSGTTSQDTAIKDACERVNKHFHKNN